MKQQALIARPGVTAAARRGLARWRQGGLAEPAAYLVLAGLVLSVLLLTDRGMLAPDTKPHLYLDPLGTLREALSTWRPNPYLGQPNFDAGLAPAALVVLVIRSLGVEPWLAIRLWRALLLLVAGVGAARLFQRAAAGRLEGRGGGSPVAASLRAGRVVAAVLYVVNPYVVVAGATTPVLLPYALLPWLLLALGRSAHEPRSWRWPAAFALAFFASSGMNAGVVALFMLLAVPCWLAFERHVNGLPWRQLASSCGRCLALSLLVSLYWLVPALLASATAAGIAGATEAPRDVAGPSSWAETVRLLGLWTLYGRSGDQPFLPGLVGYLTNPLVVVASFALPAVAAGAALYARHRARVLAAYLLAVGAPVMVGLFGGGAVSPFGRLLEIAFERVPGAIAFRTTNKAGGLVALALTLLIALGANELATRPGVRRQVRAVVGAAGVLLLALAVLPVWTGGLNLLRFRIPDYWLQAARDLDAGPATSRVLLVPGQVLSDYRWGLNGPDDLNESLLRRPSAVRVTVPNGSAAQGNYMAALDTALDAGAPDGGTVSAMARYLGAGEVLARYDTRWEAVGGPRPSALEGTLRRDPGLRQGAVYGQAGQYTVAGQGAAPGDAGLSPLERFSVTDARPVMRTEPSAGTLLVDGDNFALPALAGQGLLAGQPAVRLLGAATADEAAVALDDGARVVLTDTGRRRSWEIHRTGQSYSPTLRADEPVANQGASLNLFDEPAAQSVSELEGARAVSATSSGTAFGLAPRDKPVYAFDGDQRTAWVTGGFGTAVGQSIAIEFGRVVRISKLVLRPLRTDPVRISSVRVRLNGRSVDAEVPDQPEVTVPVPETDAASLRVEITGVRGGPGLNAVGFSEIGVPGVKVTERIRLPERFRRVVEALDGPARERLATTPIDVLLTRAAGDPVDQDDDEERVLARSFWLPDARGFKVGGRLSASGLPEPVLDRLAGASDEVSVSSSSRSFDSPTVRASKAFDGNRDTAWIPGGRGEGEWIQVAFPDRALDHVVVRQDVPPRLENKQGLDQAVRAELTIDGQPVKRVALRTPATRIDFPRRTAHEVRLTVTEVAGLGGGIRISEFEAGGAQVEDAAPTAGDRCIEVAKLDGAPLRVVPSAGVAALTSGATAFFEPCPGQRLQLGAGFHQLKAEPGWLLDLVRLQSTSGADGRKLAPTPKPAPPPRVSVAGSSPTKVTVATEAARGPYYLVLGQGFDNRWRATMDGLPLGPPLLVDGYATGWRIPDTGAHVVTMAFTPQRWASASLAVSAGAIVLLLVLFLRPRRRPEDPGGGGVAAPGGDPHAEGAGRTTAAFGGGGVRQLAAHAGLVALLWFLGGWVGLLVGLATVAWDRLRRPSAADLLRAALAGFCLLPLAVVARGLPRPSTVTPLFAGSNLVAHYLAGAALALLVLGILRDVPPAARQHPGPGDGPPGGGDPGAPPPPEPRDRPIEPATADAPPTGNGPRPGRQPAPPAMPVPPPWGPGREYQPPRRGSGPPGQRAEDGAAR
ncbi:MAG TPA: alpha-(1-_3)-arabinofuranosyltransferase family protein [Actinomycetota bacterium]|nr:alpha-(1->3)-arabinofuranosyltransferase family protein [Actinomycetota bacterium]